MSARSGLVGKNPPGPIWGHLGPFFAWAGKIGKMWFFCLFLLFYRFGALAAIHPRWGNRYWPCKSHTQGSCCNRVLPSMRPCCRKLLLSQSVSSRLWCSSLNCMHQSHEITGFSFKQSSIILSIESLQTIAQFYKGFTNSCANTDSVVPFERRGPGF